MPDVDLLYGLHFNRKPLEMTNGKLKTISIFKAIYFWTSRSTQFEMLNDDSIGTDGMSILG